jgi:ferredoxin
MATFQDRYPKNVPGKYYIDAQCTDCDLCRECAPNNIRRDDEHGYSYVFNQPSTPTEIAACEEGVQGCPTQAVGNDGDQNDWRTSPIYDWTAYSESLRPFLTGLEVVSSSRDRAEFFHYIRKLFS